MSGADILETLNANTLFMGQCIIAAIIGGLEFCFPALFVDTFNTFEVYTSHRLYGAAMIVNAIIVFAMRNCTDHRVKKEVIQAFLFQFGLHIIVLLRPQVWGFLTFSTRSTFCAPSLWLQHTVTFSWATSVASPLDSRLPSVSASSRERTRSSPRPPLQLSRRSLSRRLASPAWRLRCKS